MGSSGGCREGPWGTCERGPARGRVPCSELSDKAASASAAAMLLVGSGLGSTRGGSRGASAFSVCSAPGCGVGTREADEDPTSGGPREWLRPGWGPSTPKLRLPAPPIRLEQVPQCEPRVPLGNQSSRGAAALPPCLPGSGASPRKPAARGTGARAAARGWDTRPGPRCHNSPLAVLSAWPPRSSLGSLPGPVGGPLAAGSRSLSVGAAAFSSLALLSPPGDGTRQTRHFPSPGWRGEVAQNLLALPDPPGDTST